MKLLDCSAKSWRLNSVAFSWLHGGHHTAPQYSSTGLFCALALGKALSMSASLVASCQATLPGGGPSAAWAAVPRPASVAASARARAEAFRVRAVECGRRLIEEVSRDTEVRPAGSNAIGGL